MDFEVRAYRGCLVPKYGSNRLNMLKRNARKGKHRSHLRDTADKISFLLVGFQALYAAVLYHQ